MKPCSRPQLGLAIYSHTKGKKGVGQNGFYRKREKRKSNVILVNKTKKKRLVFLWAIKGKGKEGLHCCEKGGSFPVSFLCYFSCLIKGKEEKVLVSFFGT